MVKNHKLTVAYILYFRLDFEFDVDEIRSNYRGIVTKNARILEF